MIGYRLKKLRIERGMTQTQLAQRIGVTKSTISGYELELRKPTYDILRKIAQLFGVTTDYLVGNFDVGRIDGVLTEAQITDMIKSMEMLLRLLKELDLYR